MRHFYMILVISLVVVGCKHPRKFPQRPTMPIMKIAHVSSSIMYSYMMEVEGNELAPQVQTIVVATEGDGCAMDRHGVCALPITNERIHFTVTGFAADGREIDICDQSQLAFELVHRSTVDGTDHFFLRVLTKDVDVKRIGGQCVFALTDPPAMFSSLK